MTNQILNVDCLDGFKNVPDESVDLIIADPPYFKVVGEKWDYLWRTEEDYIMVAVSPRSSVASLQEDTKSRFALLAETFGFEIEYSGEYPGWSYAEESKIRDLFVESYRDLFGSD